VKELWENLIQVMTEMLSLYQAILALSQEKRSTLIAAKAQELENITKREEAIVFQVARLEKLRINIIEKIGAAQGMNAETNTLSGIKKFADADTVRQVEQLTRSFDKVLKELLPLNQQNTTLIQQALTFVNYNINLLAQSSSGATYAPQGKDREQNAPVRVLFDQKI
jgi:FlgN protein.